MSEVRNLDGKLVCRVDEATGTVEIKIKDWKHQWGQTYTIDRKQSISVVGAAWLS